MKLQKVRTFATSNYRGFAGRIIGHFTVTAQPYHLDKTYYPVSNKPVCPLNRDKKCSILK